MPRWPSPISSRAIRGKRRSLRSDAPPPPGRWRKPRRAGSRRMTNMRARWPIDDRVARRPPSTRCGLRCHLPGRQEPRRIDRVARDQNFIMQMRPGAAPGAAELADDLMRPDMLPGDHRQAREVGVAGDDAVAVVDL